MTISYSAVVKNAKLDQIETTISTAPTMTIYNGTPPTNADTALSGNTVLATGTLPSDWLGNASGGVKSKAGTWTLTGQSGASTGTAGTFFRILTAGTAHIQGTVSATGGGADLQLDNNNIANAQSISVSSFAITSGN